MNGKLDEPGLTGASPTGPASAVGTGPGAPDSVGGESRQGLEARFHELADVWREESLVMSSVTAMSRLPSYQQIIALGPAVVPLLLRDLEQQPEHWFVALSCLTGANPIPPESRGRMDEMAQAWVRWGRERGYRWQMANHTHLRRSVERLFPQLQVTEYRITSPTETRYNCVAWAVGDATQWWWPIDLHGEGYFWPAGVARELTLVAFIQAFGTLGYVPTPNDQLEAGIEKVALYVLDGEPTHAARQLSNGKWTSKLGKFIDVEHGLEGLVGSLYGAVAQILQRPGQPLAPLADLGPPA